MDDAWAEVELYRWLHGELPRPEEVEKKLDIPAALEAMARAIEAGSGPTRFNLIQVLHAVARWFRAGLESNGRMIDLLKRVSIQEKEDGWWFAVRGSRCGAVRFDAPKESIARFALEAFEADRRALVAEAEKEGKA